MRLGKDQTSVLTNPQKWETLNRRSFGSDLAATFKHLNLTAPRRTEQFVACRNKLIHEGTFRCSAEPATVTQDPSAPQTPTDEYLFIAGYVDSIIMQLFGVFLTESVA